MNTVPSIKNFLNPYLKQNKLYLWVFFVTVFIAAFETSFQAYLMKWLIDTITKTPAVDLLAKVIWPAILYVSMDLYHNLTMRAYLLACMKMYPPLKMQVVQDLFKYTSKHSINFFQTNLAGDIASKIQDVSSGIEPLIRNILKVSLADLQRLLLSLYF